MGCFTAIFAVIIFTPLILTWLLISRWRRLSRKARNIGIAVILSPLAVGIVSEARYILIQEPLWGVAYRGDAARVESLLKLGADPDISENMPITALASAAEEGHTEVVRILIAHGADVNARDRWTGETALYLAQKNGHQEIVEMLRKAGAK